MNRKEMVKALGEHFGVKPKYLGVPSFNYQIETATGIYIIDRAGKITDAGGNDIEFETLLNGATAEEVNEPIADEPVELEITISMDGHTGQTLKNLVNMIYSKQKLIKKALEIEENIVNEELKNLVNEIRDKTIKVAIADKKCKGIDFDFHNSCIIFKLGKVVGDPEKIKVYQELFELMNQQAKTLRHASAKVKDTDNEKFTFRVWIIRLGMVGNEYKETRKILLRNLTGNSAFRYGKTEKETTAGE